MDFKIRYSKSALADLETVFEYWRTNFPSSTSGYGSDLLSHIEILSTFPFMGAHVRNRRGIRKIFHSPYTIYYRVQPAEHTVEIVHIWHGSRRKPKLEN